MRIHLIEEEAADLLANPDTPADIRLLLLALSRVDGEGVAGFAKGELGRLLSAPLTGGDGPSVPFTSKGLRWLLRKGERRGIFAHGSTEQEVALTFAYRVQSADGVAA